MCLMQRDARATYIFYVIYLSLLIFVITAQGVVWILILDFGVSSALISM